MCVRAPRPRRHSIRPPPIHPSSRTHKNAPTAAHTHDAHTHERTHRTRARAHTHTHTVSRPSVSSPLLRAGHARATRAPHTHKRARPQAYPRAPTHTRARARATVSTQGDDVEELKAAVQVAPGPPAAARRRHRCGSTAGQNLCSGQTRSAGQNHAHWSKSFLDRSTSRRVLSPFAPRF